MTSIALGDLLVSSRNFSLLKIWCIVNVVQQIALEYQNIMDFEDWNLEACLHVFSILFRLKRILFHQVPVSQWKESWLAGAGTQIYASAARATKRHVWFKVRRILLGFQGNLCCRWYLGNQFFFLRARIWDWYIACWLLGTLRLQMTRFSQKCVLLNGGSRNISQAICIYSLCIYRISVFLITCCCCWKFKFELNGIINFWHVRRSWYKQQYKVEVWWPAVVSSEKLYWKNYIGPGSHFEI